MFATESSCVVCSLAEARIGICFKSFRERTSCFRILHCQQIVIATFGIDPVAGGNHPVRGQGGDDVIDHFFLAESDQTGPLAVDIDAQRWIVNILRNQNVAYPFSCRILVAMPLAVR